MDEMGGPGNLINSRIASHQCLHSFRRHWLKENVHEESCRHPTQTELPEAIATVSRPRHVNSSAAEIGCRTAEGALIGCIANS
jgi:hypothetical protein